MRISHSLDSRRVAKVSDLVAVTVVAVVIWLLAVLGMVARVRVMVKLDDRAVRQGSDAMSR